MVANYKKPIRPEVTVPGGGGGGVTKSAYKHADNLKL